MRADTFNLTKIFGAEARYVVPLFQRPYVWNREKNWEPLWDDVRRVATEVEQHANIHPHFLGAIVLASVEPEFGQLPTWEIIDGQQRLTTLQLLLAAGRSAVANTGDERAARVLGKFIENDEDLVPQGHPHARFKVWPTNADQASYLAAVELASGPGSLVDARRWFEAEISTWLASAADLDERVDALVLTLRERLRLVVIDLEKDDDAQVIFETLNGRGTPLEAADLVKNLLFRLARAHGDDLEHLYSRWWEPFDGSSWRKQISVGRQFRSRLDVYLTHWVSMKTRREVTASSLYAAFDDWLGETKPLPEDVFAELARFAELYESFEHCEPGSYEERFFDRLNNAHQTQTAIPLLLHLWGLGEVLDADRRRRVLQAIDSYLMRRAVWGGSTKDYNNVFRDLFGRVADAHVDDIDRAAVDFLAEQTAESRLWPRDADFRSALEHERLFRTMVRNRLRALLEGIEHELRRSGMSETVTSKSLTVEHVLPRSWEANWGPRESVDADARDRALHTLGNLTLVTARLNPSMSNGAWADKKAALGRHSLLKLTTDSILHAPPGVSDPHWPDAWDERRIAERGTYLASLAERIWPSPESFGAAPLNPSSVIVKQAPGPSTVVEQRPAVAAHSADSPGKGTPRQAAIDTADLPMTCRVCGETKPGSKFPTFSVIVPGQFPRDDECRDCQRQRRGASG